MTHSMPLRLWIALLACIAIAGSASGDDTRHILHRALAESNNATTAALPPCAWSVRLGSDYSQCVGAAHGQIAISQPFMFTPANTDWFCTIPECRLSILLFASSVTTDCTLQTESLFVKERTVDIKNQEIQQMAATCKAYKAPTTAPPTTPTPAPRAVNVDDGPSPLRIVLIVVGCVFSTFFALCAFMRRDTK